MEIEPLPPDSESAEDAARTAAERGAFHRRFLVAMAVYAVLGVLAALRLDGRPRLVVLLFLGLFAFRTALLVLKQRAD